MLPKRSPKYSVLSPAQIQDVEASPKESRQEPCWEVLGLDPEDHEGDGYGRHALVAKARPKTKLMIQRHLDDLKHL